MADFSLELPTNIITECATLGGRVNTMMKKMTRAGAKAAKKRVTQNMPQSWKKSGIKKCLKLTKTYKTPSDGGINTKVVFAGYFINKKGVKTPAPLVVNVTEYGTSERPKHPFFRRSFVAKEIEAAMLAEQDKYLGGLE